MTGLRARQKADRHRRIIDAATELFREAGYEGAKIEAIAAQAEVSIGTIYNYYQNKGDILGAIVAMEVNEVLNAGQGVVCSPPADVGDALDRLIGIYIGHSLNYLSKEMWRQAMAISTQLPDSPFGQAYTALDRDLTEQIRALIARLQEIGLVRSDIDGPAVGELIFNNMNMMFIEFVKRDEAKIPELRAAIKRQNRILVAAIGV
ncbi:TetR/AcrR family transcriptional regulator [Mesorhizobium sp.]|uniref:TetR/AcrR family transcriptional regulator n=1 Tax=Mesorhizobium sp. TaxID=1871066 RepID=UPI000FE57541|nr:TetR/AcrR family transcriptional regulator [Mesorhizobium sp.]RWG02294.1 MAG: TetR/AcrR family transcriptional regulator [Mesorhizobium sp.]RWG96258.1 MAG: TetR/AcrR family transcriptional regulator [Mesorhizobium sp.]TIN47557.1 MAG: TetR/AcrR family transcriptional regulator [Mesorhizobium sp.]TIR93153.1 MAG: TetR/AcrR family transcriptional regulator [Mesorhizobium sp.]TIS03553.1 MAG: TetR/AcrR family transcriptional regulator [Mesorhizobium sp.]